MSLARLTQSRFSATSARRLTLALVAALLSVNGGCVICVRPPLPADMPLISRSTSHTMLDRETGQVWSREVGDPRGWEDARDWCEALTFDDRDNWRLPSLDELRRLYDPRFEQPCNDTENPCRVDPELELGEPWFWSGTSGGAGRRYYIDFRFGTEFSPMLKPGLRRRVLCVADPERGAPAHEH